MIRLTLNLVVVCAISGCASGPTVEQMRISASKTVVGRITDRFDMQAIPNNETSVPGAVGMLVSQVRGTSRHYRYWVNGNDGTLYAYHSVDLYSIGDCL